MMENEPLSGLEVAVIGMAGRFPAADNIHEFWENIKNGIESFQFFSEEELEKSGVSPGLYNHPDFVKSNGGFLQGIEYFDADFFGYTPTEAELLDPQMRLFHECSWEALEDAGYDPETYEGLIGLFAGAEDNVEWRKRVLLSSTETASEHTRLLLSNKDFVSARVSYKLNLKGPVYAIVTGCSTAMTSIHLACRSLLNGECDMAMAGGVYVHTFSPMGCIYEEGSLFSRDGHLRAFDARASGTVFSSGVGIVVLKILEDARADNDHIYAVIKGSAVNSDGNQKVNFTAPSIKGQAEVITAAYQAAEVDPETIGYLETHGTGTPLGDPIEISALKQAFNMDPGWRCPIGSVKTNMGHMDTAAGVIGFIKTVLVLIHKQIPPTLHFEIPNPKLELEKTPFYVNTELQELKRNGAPRRAAVSSFGFGGTNAHVILEEAPIAQSAGRKAHGALSKGRGGVSPPDQWREYQLILLSAKTETALEKMTENLVEYFQHHLLNHDNHVNPVNPGLTLADAAYTLQVGRQPFRYRKMCPGSNLDEVIQALPASPVTKVNEDPPLVFMFSGQGSQYVNMGLGIYRSEPVFREEMDHGFDILKSLTGKDFKAIFYPGPDSPDIDNIQEQMNDAHNSGPIKFIFEYSLGKLLIHWGIRPHALMGHSFGEYTAASLADVFSVRDALELALIRGELMLHTPAGGMMSIPLGQEQLSLYLETHPNVSLAAVNSSSLCFVSGPPGPLQRLEKELQEKGIECMPINFPRAAHSHMMKPITAEIEKKVRTIKLGEPTIPFISGLTGDWVSPGEITDPTYWAKHLEQPVLFCQGIENLLKEPGSIFVQVGPDKGLPLFVNQHRLLEPGTLAINIARHKKDRLGDMAYLLQQLGTLWHRGVEIDWTAFQAGSGQHRVSLPTYPFERKRYWLDVDPYAVLSGIFSRGRLEKRKHVPDWLYTSSWKRCPLPGKSTGHLHNRSPILIFSDNCRLGTRLAGKLEENGRELIMVKPGKRYEKENPRGYRINPRDAGDYHRLFEALKIQNKIPGLMIHLWNITGKDAADLTSGSLETILDLGLYSLLHIVQVIGRLDIYNHMHLQVVTDNMQRVVGEEFLCPAKAAILGAVRVIPQEYDNISCHALDIILPEPGSPVEEQLLRHLVTALDRQSFKTMNSVTALRGDFYWTQSFEPIPVEEPPAIPPRLRQGGVYLVTGGLGGIGFVLSGYLVKTVKAKLILTGRTQLPPKDQWQHWLDTHPPGNRVSQKIKKVINLEQLGAEVLVFSADTANPEQMQEVITRAKEHFGQINGIIHTAGLVDEHGMIRGRTREMTEQVLAPKVKGTMVLHQLTEKMPLDFFIICSSIASLFPGFGEVGYAAANMFIDAFAHYKNLIGSTFTTAVNWDTWQEVGAAVDIVNRQKQAGKTSYVRLQDGIRPAEGVEAFTFILENTNPQVVVSTKDLELLLKQRYPDRQQEEQAPGETGKIEKTTAKRNLKPRPKLSTTYTAPCNPLQENLVNIWQDYFGIAEVGIHDDFFELGGDSLMATIMAARIHKRMDIRIPLTEIFQGPTVEQLSKYIKDQEEEEFETIPLVEKKEYYHLSPAQKRLFILQQLEPGLISYNSPDFFILEGELDKNRLNQALDKMIQRHESLRTSFEMVEGVPVQRVADHIDTEIECYTAGEEEAGLMVKDFVRVFDLRQAPLLRVGLVHLHTPTALHGHPSQEGRAQKYIYMFDMHHIVTDGISLEIFADEFLALYEGQLLPPLTIRYKDFAQWQIHLLESGEIKKQEEYWLKEFAGETPILDLPADYPRPEAQSFAGRKFQVRLSHGDTRGLNRLSREQDVTLYMTTLAVMKVLFSRLSSQETIVIGTITAGRQHEDLQHIIGMFVNTLALKSYPAGDKTFSQYLRELKQKSLAVFENQDYPFEELVSQLNLDRHMNRNPLFDVMFSFQNFEAPAVEISQSQSQSTARSTAQLSKKAYAFEDLAARFDITLFVRETPDTLLFNWEYCTKLFKQETIERFGNYLKKIVSTILYDPGIPLGMIEIISEEEKQRVLYEFNNTEADYPREMTIHELFAIQVEKNPDHIALIGVGTRFIASDPGKQIIHITYLELNQKSHQLACWLQEKGVVPDAIVAIMMDRSPEMIIGILAILKAGGAYLPIDPDYPQERINYMLTDSGAEILLTTPGLSREIKYENEVVHATDAINRVPTPPHLHLQPAPATSLAYIIYTSGTTGRSKGVMIEHSNVVRLLFNEKFQFDFNAEDVWTMFHSYCFDFSVWEMYGALLYGAKLIIIPRTVAMNPRHYLEILKEKVVTILNQTPSAFYRLMEEEIKQPGNNLKLKYVIFGGEALNTAKLSQWALKYPGTELINMFGITETTVHVTFKRVSEKDIKVGISNIGKAIPTLSTYIMDKHSLLPPVGVPGECCVGGEGVGRGYLNRPELTVEKFVTNPFKPGERLYRSGDLVRYLGNGEMEYLGRIDHQVKIRGFRIELGEIESRLLEHGDIKEAVVMAEEEKSGTDARSLSAYILSNKDKTLTGPQLREFLLNRLPEYMIPAHFIQVDFLPLTPNGKVNRKELKSLGVRLSTGTAFVPPGNELEKTIANAWKNILKIETIGINDNFFDVGGNSLSILNLATQLRQVLKEDIPVEKLFQYPTIALFARYLGQQDKNYLESREPSEEETDLMLAHQVEHAKNRLKKRRIRDDAH
jgi:amino acid adenylation domain-containing protein